MFVPRIALLIGLLSLLCSGTFAQSISTGSLTSVPTLSAGSLLLLGIALAASAWLVPRRGGARHATIAIAVIAAAFLIVKDGPVSWAAVLADFTSSSGETLAIPVIPVAAGPDTAGWELADYSNASGAMLRITDVVLPTGIQCLGGGISGSLLPAGVPPPAPPPNCSVGGLLAAGASCRVDVDTTCRALVAGILPSINSLNANSGSASGGTGITVSGTNLGSAIALTFDGVPATSVYAVNSTTVTAVTPAHAVGAVDVVITTAAGNASLSNGFTYLATSVGLPAHGGIIAALGGGFNNLIAANTDSSASINWSNVAALVGPGAQSLVDGASNTAAIVALGNNTAAQVCDAYEIDSQGNTPCQPGMACYSDWAMPAMDQLRQLFTNRVTIGGFVSVPYWSSTEDSPTLARGKTFDTGVEFFAHKFDNYGLRCVRSFTP